MLDYTAIEALVADVLKNCRDNYGGEFVDPSKFYGALLNLGKSFQHYDRPIADFLAQQPKARRYVDIGTGIGTLPVLLASKGMPAVGVERAPARYRPMCELFASVRQADPSADLTAVLADFPSAEVKCDRETVMIFNCLTTNCSVEHEQMMLEACREAQAIVIDLVRFTRARSSLQAWKALGDRVCALGFGEPVNIYAWGQPTGDHEAPKLSPGRLVYFPKA